MNINYLTAFADWISLSYPTSLSPSQDIVSYFSRLSDFGYSEIGAGKELYKSLDGGSLFVTTKEHFVNISISGSLLSIARSSGTFNDLVQILASAPHNITRLDVAYDMPIAGSLAIKGIQRLYPTGYARIAGRSRRLQYVSNQLSADDFTGTVYFQNRNYKGTVHLRVYDKAHELSEVHDVTVRPTTRYELTVGRGASLRDFTHPNSIFWHFVPPELLTKPKTLVVSPWRATERIDYDAYSGSLTTDYERLRFFIHNSPALVELVRNAANVNGGLDLLHRTIKDLSVNAEGMERSGDALCDLRLSTAAESSSRVNRPN